MVEERLHELENDIRSSLLGKFRSWISCRIRFLGLPGVPLTLNLQGIDSRRQREQPVFSPEASELACSYVSSVTGRIRHTFS